MPEKRSCGECTECCRVLAIDELDSGFKKNGVWCPKRKRGTGCTIYDSRPTGCRSFQCLWLQGIGKPGDRPDRSGIVLDFAVVENGLPGGVLQVWEGKPNALRGPLAIAATDNALGRGIWVTHLPFGLRSRTIFVPRERKITADIQSALDEDGIRVGVWKR